MLGRALATDLMSLYGFARAVDQIGDASTGNRLVELAEMDAALDRLCDGGATTSTLQDFADTVRRHRIPLALAHDLVQANRQDQTVHRYQTFSDLLDYCTLSANPVGRMVLAVVGAATPDNVVLSDRICSALQIIEHLQDVAEDQMAGRIYLPQQDLAELGCTEDDLWRQPGSRQVRAVIAVQAQRAAELLDSGAPLVGRLRGRSRLAVAGFVAGGRATLAALAGTGHVVCDPGPRPRRGRLLREWVSLTVGGGR